MTLPRGEPKKDTEIKDSQDWVKIEEDIQKVQTMMKAEDVTWWKQFFEGLSGNCIHMKHYLFLTLHVLIPCIA
jgi:hypothetical protein